MGRINNHIIEYVVELLNANILMVGSLKRETTKLLIGQLMLLMKIVGKMLFFMRIFSCHKIFDFVDEYICNIYCAFVIDVFHSRPYLLMVKNHLLLEMKNRYMKLLNAMEIGIMFLLLNTMIC